VEVNNPMSTAPVITAGSQCSREVATELHLLGGFSVTVTGESVDLSIASQRLLALIAIHGQPISRTLAASTLWPEKPEARAYANLRSCLWRLKDPGLRHVLVGHGSTLALGHEVASDLDRLGRLGWGIVDGTVLVDVGQDADLFLRPLLPGWYDDWVVMERERLAQLQARFLESLVAALITVGDLTHALDYAVRLVAADPLRERSQLCLMRVYATEGSWGQLHAQLRSYEDLLSRTFGCGGTAAFRSAVAELIAPVSRNG
jgi:DNA-binding SARP family transcriptional activator